MDLLYIVLGATVIGLSLGLLGSGGSILTVPVLVYLLHHPGKQAFAESIVIVGGIACIGAIPYALKRSIDWRSVLWFGPPAMAGMYLGSFVSQFALEEVQLAVFSGVMLLAAWSMGRPKSRASAEFGAALTSRKAGRVVLDGVFVGTLTGFVGVGGGFMIVPALVVLGGLPMGRAVGTSLVIVVVKAVPGFVKHAEVVRSLDLAVDWATVVAFLIVGGVGTLAGGVVGGRLNQRLLERVFAVFLVMMSLFILIREVPELVGSGDIAGAAETAPAEERR